MWVSERHPDRERLLSPRPAAAPPEPSGRELARFDRPGRGSKPDGRLVLSLESFNGSSYLSARVWQRGADGVYYPTKSGTSIRLAEVEDLADALLEGLRLAHAAPARLPSAAPARRRAAPTVAPPTPATHTRPPTPPLPLLDRDKDRAGAFSPDFDEFDA